MMNNLLLTRGIDFYKPTMSQFAYEKQPDALTTFTLKNRAETQLGAYVSPEELRERFDAIRENGFQAEEVAYLASLQAQDGSARFTQDYLDHLMNLRLPPLDITQDPTGDIGITSKGPWSDVSFWETVVMSELNERYYANKLHAEGLSIGELYDEGDRRLGDKISRLQAHPGIKIVDFGTRRRFSAQWHEHVLERLITECPDNFSGTSKVWFDHQFGLKPIGTFAHDLPLGYAAFEDAACHIPLDGNHMLLVDWYERYGEDLSIALTDTFGSEFFFTDFDREQAAAWRGLRHDSGDPFVFGERVINFYDGLGVDPQSKTLVFSDGLDITSIEDLHRHFGKRIKLLFGWGTTLTNDLGLRANNFVMKATSINGTDTVKLSDVAGKHTGPEKKVNQYEQLVQRHLGNTSIVDLVSV